MNGAQAELMIGRNGSIRCIYAEAISLATLGSLSIARGSHVEPNSDGHWTADLSPVDGPILGPFKHRTEALRAEHEWLTAKWLAHNNRTD